MAITKRSPPPHTRLRQDTSRNHPQPISYIARPAPPQPELALQPPSCGTRLQTTWSAMPGRCRSVQSNGRALLPLHSQLRQLLVADAVVGEEGRLVGRVLLSIGAARARQEKARGEQQHVSGEACGTGRAVACDAVRGQRTRKLGSVASGGRVSPLCPCADRAGPHAPRSEAAAGTRALVLPQTPNLHSRNTNPILLLQSSSSPLTHRN